MLFDQEKIFNFRIYGNEVVYSKTHLNSFFNYSLRHLKLKTESKHYILLKPIL